MFDSESLIERYVMKYRREIISDCTEKEEEESLVLSSDD